MLLRSAGERYAGRVLTTVTEALPDPSVGPRGAPSLETLETVQQTNHIVVLLQRHYTQRVAPQVAKSLNEQTNCGIERAAALDALEAAVDACLYRLLSCAFYSFVSTLLDAKIPTVIIAHIERLLSTLQRKSDWRVKEEDELNFAAEEAPSRACSAVCSFVMEVAARVQATLDGRNVSSFLGELASRMQRVIWTHVRLFQVSVGIGGMRLMRDMGEYRDLVKRLHISPAVEEGYAQLKEAANIFVVPPTNLRPLLEESSLLARLPASERLGLVRQRTDFKSNWIGRYV